MSRKRAPTDFLSAQQMSSPQELGCVDNDIIILRGKEVSSLRENFAFASANPGAGTD